MAYGLNFKVHLVLQEWSVTRDPFPAEVHGCSPIGPHYTLRIASGLTSHSAFEYVRAMDSAFSPYASLKQQKPSS